ncbi:hypothetical protein NON20_08775 [Synechocystis sp. B12]|nr:hypothetical protein NON20_08775 [Synechocystis sp. B12]
MLNESDWLLWLPDKNWEDALENHIKANRYLDQFLKGELAYSDYLDALNDCFVNVENYVDEVEDNLADRGIYV